MSMFYEQRLSESPLVQMVARGQTTSDGRLVRPAENCWHMVIVKHLGHTQLLLVGPWTDAGVATYLEGAEITWIKFELGTFMPKQPMTSLRNLETKVSNATDQSFWLNDAAWASPDFENAELFVDALVRDGVLRFDTLAHDLLHDDTHDLAPRTVRHRMVQATGLSLGHIRQVERANRAATLLGQGVPILEVMFRLGYFDQPHLTKALKRWVGYTPGQLIRLGS